MSVSFLKIFIYFLERETGLERRRGKVIEGDTESETGTRLPAVSTEPDVGLEFTNDEIMIELKSDAQLTEPPRRPDECIF